MQVINLATQSEALVGFEPTNHGFAGRSLRPLGHSAMNQVSSSYLQYLLRDGGIRTRRLLLIKFHPMGYLL